MSPSHRLIFSSQVSIWTLPVILHPSIDKKNSEPAIAIIPNNGMASFRHASSALSAHCLHASFQVIELPNP